MEVAQIKEFFGSWFNFKEWRSYINEPYKFVNRLDEFGVFEVYNNFKEFLEDNQNWIDDVNYELQEKDSKQYEVSEILENKDVFCMFVDRLNTGFDSLEYKNINKPFIYVRVYDTTEAIEFFELAENIKSEDDLIIFINNVLSDIEKVTHSSGLKNKYEVVSRNN